MSRRFGLWLWLVIGLGAVVRVVLGLLTDGSAFDMESYRLAAEQLRVAPLDFYSALGSNEAFRWPYPPLFLPWVLAARELADSTGVSFHSLLGVPAILADCAIAWFVSDFLGRRGATDAKRLVAVTLIAFGPPFFTTAGYLPHFDSVAFLPAVIAVWAWDRGGPEGTGVSQRALVAGLLIGVGCALKTVPILTLLALLPNCRNRREGMTLVAAAVAVPLVSLLPFLISTPGDVLGSFDYAGVPGAGGLSLVVQPEMAERWLTRFHDLNRFNEILFVNRSLWNVLTLGLIGAFLFRRRTEPVLAATLLWLTSYVTGTGFFFQYLIWGLPFMLMAGFVWQVAAIELVVALPIALFYFGPWQSGAIPVVYATLMIGLWIGFVIALVRLIGRERKAAAAEGRERLSALAVITSRLGAVGRRLLPADRRGLAPRAPAASRTALIAAFAALAVFAFLSLALVASNAGPDETLTGADGFAAADQLQYLSWIEDSSDHVLVANPYSLAPSSHVYLQPMIAISGAVDRITGSLRGSYLLWKPIALALLFASFWLYVRRFLGGRWTQLAALAIALFFASPVGPLADWLGFGGARVDQLLSVTGEAFSATLLWGYLPAAVALALTPLFLLGLEGVLEPGRRRAGWSRRRYLLLTSLAGLLAAWIHPWHGELALLIVAGLAIWKPAGMRRRDLAVPALATLAPLLYYLLLTRDDAAWELTRLANEQFPLLASMLLLGLAPLALPALLGAAATTSANGAGERLLRIWPLAAVALHYLGPTVPGHALEGIALPLAILAVRGCQALALPRGRPAGALAALAAAALIVPGAAWTVQQFDDVVKARVQPHFLAAGERQALEFLRDSPRPGGVLSTAYLGPAVPAFAERPVWAGHPSWTPEWPIRATLAEQLFDGELAPADARRLVAGSGAAFLVSDCKGRADLTAALGPLLEGEHRFGCATVYDVAGAG